MAVFPIRYWGDPILRHEATEVEAVDDPVRKLIRDLRETMAAAPGVGLAAPQIGVSKRVIVWRYEEDDGVLVNPRVVEHGGREEGEEACLSVPGLAYPVVRAEWVRVEGLGESGDEVVVSASGWTARILQHEIDHTNGILFIDRLSPELQREARRRLREQALGETPPVEPASIL
jgi:peptide deformylase